MTVTNRVKAVSPVATLRARIDAWPAALAFTFTFLLLLAVYVPTATYDGNQSPDGMAAAVPAWQFVTHGNFTLDAFEGDLRWFVDNGDRIVSNRQPGVIFFAIPFYWLLGADASFPTLGPAGLAAAVAAALAMAVLHLVFRRIVSPSAAFGAALVAGLATSTWSVSADALWPHGPDQLWLAAALVLLAAERYAASGLAFAAAVFTRPHTAVVAAACGLWASWKRRSLRPAATLGLTASLGLGAVFWYNAIIFAGGLPNSTVVGAKAQQAQSLIHMSPLQFGENLLGTLVSPDRGVLVMSPFLLLLLPGLRAAWRAAPTWVRSAAVGGLLYLLVQLRVNYFSGGDNFYSYRLPIETLTMAAPLLLLAYREWTSARVLRRRLFFALVAVSVAIQGVGAVFYRVAFDQRSAWANFKLWETLSGTHPGATAALLTAVGCAFAAMALIARSQPAHQAQGGAPPR